MGARESECQNSQNYILHMKFSEFYLCFYNSCEISHPSLALEKCKKNERQCYSGTRFLSTEN